METNLEIKLEGELSAGINVVKESEGDNDDVLKEESSSACSKDRYKYEERTDEISGNKEIEPANTDVSMYNTSHFGYDLAQSTCLLIL